MKSTETELYEALQAGVTGARLIRAGDKLAADDPAVKADRAQQWFVPDSWPSERKAARRAALMNAAWAAAGAKAP